MSRRGVKLIFGLGRGLGRAGWQLASAPFSFSPSARRGRGGHGGAA